MSSAVPGPIPEAPPVLRGDRVHRIHWVLGTDRLRAVCHCGAERVFDDPVELWEWLLGHPAGHDTPAADPAGGVDAPARGAPDPSPPRDRVPATAGGG